MRITRTFSETFPYGPGLWGNAGWVQSSGQGDFAILTPGQLTPQPIASGDYESAAQTTLYTPDADWTQDFSIGYEMYMTAIQSSQSEDPAVWVGDASGKFVALESSSSVGDAGVNQVRVAGGSADGSLTDFLHLPCARSTLHQFLLVVQGNTGTLYLDGVSIGTYAVGDRSGMASLLSVGIFNHFSSRL